MCTFERLTQHNTAVHVAVQGCSDLQLTSLLNCTLEFLGSAFVRACVRAYAQAGQPTVERGAEDQTSTPGAAKSTVCTAEVQMQ